MSECLTSVRVGGFSSLWLVVLTRTIIMTNTRTAISRAREKTQHSVTVVHSNVWYSILEYSNSFEHCMNSSLFEGAAAVVGGVCGGVIVVVGVDGGVVVVGVWAVVSAVVLGTSVGGFVFRALNVIKAASTPVTLCVLVSVSISNTCSDGEHVSSLAQSVCSIMRTCF